MTFRIGRGRALEAAGGDHTLEEALRPFVLGSREDLAWWPFFQDAAAVEGLRLPQADPLLRGRERVLGFLDRAKGAKVLTGGGTNGDRGFFVKPTVIVDVDQTDEIVQREVFGPVVTVQRFTGFEEALAVHLDHENCLEVTLLRGPTAALRHFAESLIAETVPSRSECGLPEKGFVFCSFNNTYKITPDVFVGRDDGLWVVKEEASHFGKTIVFNTHTIDAARLNGVKRYLYTSSACIYPGYLQKSADVTPLKEEDAYPAQPQDAYGWEKLVTEKLCEYYASDYGMETRIVRIFNTYGPRMRMNDGRVVPAFVGQALAGKPIESIDAFTAFATSPTL